MRKFLCILVASITLNCVSNFANGQMTMQKTVEYSSNLQQARYDLDDEYDEFLDYIKVLRNEASKNITKLRKARLTEDENGTTIEEYYCIYECTYVLENIVEDYYIEMELLKLKYGKRQHKIDREMKKFEKKMMKRLYHEGCDCLYKFNI